MLTVQIAAIVKLDAQWRLDKIAPFVPFDNAFFLNERERKDLRRAIKFHIARKTGGGTAFEKTRDVFIERI